MTYDTYSLEHKENLDKILTTKKQHEIIKYLNQFTAEDISYITYFIFGGSNSQLDKNYAIKLFINCVLDNKSLPLNTNKIRVNNVEEGKIVFLKLIDLGYKMGGLYSFNEFIMINGVGSISTRSDDSFFSFPGYPTEALNINNYTKVKG